MNYQPIACGLYDQLEIWAMRKINVEIHFFSEQHTIHQINDRISTLKTLQGVEYAVLASGQNIRLDRILQINGQLFERSCKLGS